MDGLESNTKLSLIARKYVLKLDSNVAGMFTELDISSKDFSIQLGKKMSEKSSEEKQKEAQKTWTEIYYPYGLTLPSVQSQTGLTTPQQQAQLSKVQLSAPSLAEITAYGQLANLTYLQKEAFYEYVQQAQRAGIESLEEKTLVTNTLVKLNAINPFLTVKYLYAIKHIAELTKDNPNAYFETLVSLSANISALTRSLFDPTGTTQYTPLEIRTIISTINNAFEDILKIDASAMSVFTRYNLLDRNLFIDPNPPHAIRQRPPLWKYPITAGQDAITGISPPYPFPNYLLNVPYQPGFANLGGVYNSTYGGSVTLPQFNMFQLTPGAGIVKASVENYISPTHPILGISEYLPRTYISPISYTELIKK